MDNTNLLPRAIDLSHSTEVYVLARVVKDIRANYVVEKEVEEDFPPIGDLEILKIGTNDEVRSVLFGYVSSALEAEQEVRKLESNYGLRYEITKLVRQTPHIEGKVQYWTYDYFIYHYRMY